MFLTSGEPSDASKSVVAKPRHLAPYIDRKNLGKKKIRSGEMLAVEADVRGEPGLNFLTVGFG